MTKIKDGSPLCEEAVKAMYADGRFPGEVLVKQIFVSATAGYRYIPNIELSLLQSQANIYDEALRGYKPIDLSE